MAELLSAPRVYRRSKRQGVLDMRSVLLWLLGVPISIIILLNIFNVI
jgi:hypothetical protein